MRELFNAIKEALANAAMLRHPRPNAVLALTTDASNVAMGGVLEQRGPNGWEPLGFFSARLKNNERNWPPFDRELLAAFRSIRHFCHMVEGRRFTLYTDHQSLVPALSKKAEPHTARQTYQLSGIEVGFAALFDEYFDEKTVDLFVFLLIRVECVDGAAYCDWVILVECVDDAV